RRGSSSSSSWATSERPSSNCAEPGSGSCAIQERIFAMRQTRFVQLSLAALFLAALVGGSLPAQSSAPPAKRQSSAAPSTGAAKPTIVLVHGAFADGTGWQRVIPIL